MKICLQLPLQQLYSSCTLSNWFIDVEFPLSWSLVKPCLEVLELHISSSSSWIRTTCWGATLAPVPTKTCKISFLSPLIFLSPSGRLLLLTPFPSQMAQLQFKHSTVVLKMTPRKGITKHEISQMSIIFISEVGDSSSILLVKMVVITSMIVRFTAMASPKRSLSKKMVV